ncbi:TIGR03758 family integrating conjugative element protein [Pseudomonas oryzihabitans]|uniref:TIGR03758 family integrating conjugative element protein n=1 Tax=Pseudomonas oryzihabitans TaxID=47885 RepID=UPI00135EAA35|nr:TIGR03758 family integrating conjugative element protein [Pseudomonas oryzihabitans]MXS21614.1 TIGR03758 family integrating conjugative element protein [Pseudomonas oryzihabitans]
MSMTAAQTAAFQAASNTFWLSLAMAVITLWFAWLSVSLYKGWANQNFKAAAAKGALIRGLLLYCVLTFLILH